MRKNTIAAIVIASLLCIGAPALAGNDGGERTLKNTGRQMVWVEKDADAPHALTGKEKRAAEQDRGLERQSFGRAGYVVR